MVFTEQERRLFPPYACVALKYRPQPLCLDGSGAIWPDSDLPIPTYLSTKAGDIRHDAVCLALDSALYQVSRGSSGRDALRSTGTIAFIRPYLTHYFSDPWPGVPLSCQTGHGRHREAPPIHPSSQPYTAVRAYRRFTNRCHNCLKDAL